jgi:acetoin utilization protein AcuB
MSGVRALHPLGGMMKDEPYANAIVHFMSEAPYTIGAEQSLEQAHALMRAQRVRHLPVLRGGKLVGILSQRDLMLIESLPGVDAKDVPVEDAMTTDIYTVAPTMPVAEVATTMADRKLGSAIVTDHDRVVGVFTVTDACRALAALTCSRPCRGKHERAPGRV